MITVDEALRRILALAGPVVADSVPLARGAGRVLARAAVSRMTQPPFASAAMDGYALRAADLPGPLRVIGEAAAGHPWVGEAMPGTAVRIFTGAPVPAGYDRVVMQENCARDGDLVTVLDASGGAHIRPEGGDFAVGNGLPAGRRLRPADLGLLAAMNVPELVVARRPHVAILATGDELVTPGGTPGPGQIICSNDVALGAMAEAVGAQVDLLGIARDDAGSLRDCLARAGEADLIVTIGGASVGDHDLVGQVAAEMGLERAFYKIAMRPGKPLMAGRLAGAAMLGLPGNPVSSIVCGMIFMQPLIRAMQGEAAVAPQLSARLGCDLPAEGGRQHYLRARLSAGEDLPVIEPFSDQDSARLMLMSRADALLMRPAGDPPQAKGAVVSYLPLTQG